MRKSSMVLAGAGAVLLGAGALAHQEVFPTPRAGSGVVQVTGTVDIGNMPEIASRQSGEWVVNVSRMPEVSLAPVSFISANTRYAITWPDGSTEVVTVTETGSGAWVRVRHPAGNVRWVNLAAARALEEQRPAAQ